MSAPYTAPAVSAVTRAARDEDDFAGWLAHVLAQAAGNLGSSGALTAGRPGSWEAGLVGQLVKGTAGYGDEDLPAPVAEAASPAGQVTLSPADVLTVLGALRDGARWNDYPPGDPAAAARYRALARSLAGDR